MASMDFDDLFEQYYTLYRAEAVTPSDTDDEYTIALRLSKEAINHWATYDGVYWKELYDTNQNDGSGSQTITTGTKTYSAPTNFQEAGGYVKVLNSDGNTVQSYPIIEPQEVQFRSDDSTYCYFTKSPNYYSTGTASQSSTTITGLGTTWTSAMVGMEFIFVTGETATITAFNSTTSLTASVSQTVSSSAYRIVSNGYQLHLNPAPTSSINGMDIDYVYYRKPKYLTSGSSIPDMQDPMFIVHRMLAQRFRSSMNPYYTSAKNDAENSLKKMQIDNNSGSWDNPWSMPDNSGAIFGG